MSVRAQWARPAALSASGPWEERRRGLLGGGAGDEWSAEEGAGGVGAEVDAGIGVGELGSVGVQVRVQVQVWVCVWVARGCCGCS